MELETLGDGGERQAVTIQVAGIVALLAAKGWKIGERHRDNAATFVDVSKDVGDVYRLLNASDPGHTLKVLESVRERRHVDGSIRTGAEYLRSLCSRDGAGIRLFRSMLGASIGQRRASASLSALVEEFADAVDIVLGRSF